MTSIRILAMVLALLLIGVGTASAQTQTVGFESSYRAFNSWDAGNPSAPDPCTLTWSTSDG